MSLIRVIQTCIPESIKKKKMNELFRLTADAFGCEQPALNQLSFQECLQEYALFTKEQAERCLLEEKEPDEVKHRLYENSYRFGVYLGKGLAVLSRGKSPAALKLAYQLIRIDFDYEEQGGFTIRRCFFSRYYSAEVCRLISSLDEGLAAGLTGGRLSFTQRITEGCSCCKGRILK